ncbi:MAG: hypothetical protein GY706_04310 [Bacteroides sp.]|nr:hypothetical protein [Bacteroides sp.]
MKNLYEIRTNISRTLLLAFVSCALLASANPFSGDSIVSEQFLTWKKSYLIRLQKVAKKAQIRFEPESLMHSGSDNNSTVELVSRNAGNSVGERNETKSYLLVGNYISLTNQEVGRFRATQGFGQAGLQYVSVDDVDISYSTGAVAEICDNGIDDDGDALILLFENTTYGYDCTDNAVISASFFAKQLYLSIDGGAAFLTLTTPTYNADAGTATWTGMLLSEATVTSGQANDLTLDGLSGGGGDGKVGSYRKISYTEGSFTATLDNDGIEDTAVGPTGTKTGARNALPEKIIFFFLQR